MQPANFSLLITTTLFDPSIVGGTVEVSGPGVNQTLNLQDATEGIQRGLIFWPVGKLGFISGEDYTIKVTLNEGGYSISTSSVSFSYFQSSFNAVGAGRYDSGGFDELGDSRGYTDGSLGIFDISNATGSAINGFAVTTRGPGAVLGNSGGSELAPDGIRVVGAGIDKNYMYESASDFISLR